jgi:hypothetical protein
VQDLSNQGVKPRVIFGRVIAEQRINQSDCLVLPQDINNIRAKLRRDWLAGRSPLIAMKEELQKEGSEWYLDIRYKPQSQILQMLFITIKQ